MLAHRVTVMHTGTHLTYGVGVMEQGNLVALAPQYLTASVLSQVSLVAAAAGPARASSSRSAAAMKARGFAIVGGCGVRGVGCVCGGGMKGGRQCHAYLIF